ncbi:DUF4268 domain-containing protein [Methanolobus vulcani]|uniref:DUF4268 domain-containing protein n=1 Tax=Methanolobus vulcani TaxID=38026 RepID=A0A7Z8KRG8_9EURY|nr:DUF4268 domain-containing protein [Methanolobus vulcani]TQD25664.1 DUF4268 domain-containing protein [Methanolobus vulcani]
MKVGKIEKLPLREIWSHEAIDFTPWLEENIEILGEVIGLQLSVVEREKTIGTFSLDLLAEDADSNKVIIENQLETTDHKHLGQVLVYMIGLDAKTAIWICSDARQEHVNVINWLNEITPADMLFYLIKVEGIKIGDSLPAPLFTVTCAPSEDIKQMGKNKEEFAERHKLRLEFWERMLEKMKGRTQLHSNKSPTKNYWLSTTAGRPGLSYIYNITKDAASVGLYIDKGKDSEEINRQIFNIFHDKKDDIEANFGGPLIWDVVEGRRYCGIRWDTYDSGLFNQDKWDSLQNKLIDAMIRLERAFKKHIQELNI